MQPSRRKTGLKKTYYSRTHFSSPYVEKPAGGDASKLVVRLLDAEDLLASDVTTGTSDPCVFMWCCSREELLRWTEELKTVDSDSSHIQRTRVQRSRVCHATCDPKFDAEFVFPLSITRPEDVLEGNLLLVLRDEDRDDEGNITYDELGYVVVPLSDVFIHGRVTKSNTISLVSHRLRLLRTPSMTKVSGTVRISVFLTLSDGDLGAPVGGALAEMQQRLRGLAPSISPVKQREGSRPATAGSTNYTSPRRREWERNPSVAAPLSLRSPLRPSTQDTFPLDATEGQDAEHHMVEEAGARMDAHNLQTMAFDTEYVQEARQVAELDLTQNLTAEPLDPAVRQMKSSLAATIPLGMSYERVMTVDERHGVVRDRVDSMVGENLQPLLSHGGDESMPEDQPPATIRQAAAQHLGQPQPVRPHDVTESAPVKQPQDEHKPVTARPAEPATSIIGAPTTALTEARVSQIGTSVAAELSASPPPPDQAITFSSSAAPTPAVTEALEAPSVTSKLAASRKSPPPYIEAPSQGVTKPITSAGSVLTPPAADAISSTTAHARAMVKVASLAGNHLMGTAQIPQEKAVGDPPMMGVVRTTNHAQTATRSGQRSSGFPVIVGDQAVDNRHRTPQTGIPLPSTRDTLRETAAEAARAAVLEVSQAARGSRATTNEASSKLAKLNRVSRATLVTAHAAAKFSRPSAQRGSSGSVNSVAGGLLCAVVDRTWDVKLRECMSRLAQRETNVLGYLQLRQMLSDGLDGDQVVAFVAMIRRMTNAKPLATRRALLTLLSHTVALHSAAVAKVGDGVIQFLMERIHDPESAMQPACIQCASTIAVHLLPQLQREDPTTREVDFSRLLKPLLSALSEQSPAAQECAGLCVAAIASPTPAPFTLCVHTNAKYLDDAADALKTYSSLPGLPPPPRDMLLLSDGRLLLEFPSATDMRAFYNSRTAVGALPGDWRLEAYPRFQEQLCVQAWNAYVATLGYFAPRLLHSVLNALKSHASLRRPLYQAIANLADTASRQRDCDAIGKALALAVAPIAERVIASLKDRKSSTGTVGWKDRAEAAKCITALTRCYDCTDSLLEVKTVLVAALAQGRSDTIRHVREACTAAIAALNEVSAFVPAQTDVIEYRMDPFNNDDTQSDGLMNVRPAAETQKDEIGTGVSGPGDMLLPPMLQPGDMDLPPGFPEANDDVDGSSAQPLAPRRTVVAELEHGTRMQPSAKKGHEVGLAVDEPKAGAKSTPAGTPTAAVRALKELSKNMTRATSALERTVQQMSTETTGALASLAHRLVELEESLGRAASPPHPSLQPGIVHGARPVPLQVSTAANDSVNTIVGGPERPRTMPPGTHEGVDTTVSRSPSRPASSGHPPQSLQHTPGVSLWREVRWLLHCGEIETAYERVLIDATERDLVRLMEKTGVCLGLLSSDTKGMLFAAVAKMLLEEDPSVAEQALPWVLKAAQAGDLLDLSRPVRKELVKGLYNMIRHST